MAEKSSLSCSDWRYLLSDSANGNLIFFMKSGNKYKITRTEIKVLYPSICSITQFVFQNLTISQLFNITLTLIGLLLFIAFFTWPQSYRGSLTEFATIMKFYIFLLSPQNCRSSVNKSISLMLFQHQSYLPVHFISLDFLYIWLTYL